VLIGFALGAFFGARKSEFSSVEVRVILAKFTPRRSRKSQRRRRSPVAIKG